MGRIDLLKVWEISQPRREPVDFITSHHQRPQAVKSSDFIWYLSKAHI
jgi:hypothetical protein